MEKGKQNRLNRLEHEFRTLHAEGAGAVPDEEWHNAIMADIRALKIDEEPTMGTEKSILRFTTLAAAAALILAVATLQTDALVYTDISDWFFGVNFGLFDYETLVF